MRPFKRSRRSFSKKTVSWRIVTRGNSVMLFGLALMISALASYNRSLQLSIVETEVTRGMIAATETISSASDKRILHNNGQPKNCTEAQLVRASRQLRPTKYCCIQPWLQKCSITLATKCPNSSNWLEEYYKKSFHDNYFVAVNVGCNKGYDAIHLLRMGTRQDAIRKDEWKQAMGSGVQQGVCRQEHEPDLPLSNDEKEIPGEVHCVEPMPLTVRALRSAAHTTEFANKGFRLVQAAMADEIGTVKFPSASAADKGMGDIKIGKENKGIDSQWENDIPLDEVDLLTLDEYAKRYLRREARINVLLVDVEGFDFDVLIGGSNTLSRVEYLEFEYNWKGKWKSQKLLDAVDYLDENGFTCYWAGVQKLWRLTSCWLEHYSTHNWSNVACVGRNLVPDLAARMEQIFLETLGEEFASQVMQ